MHDNTDNTRVSLLMRLRDRADDEAWTEFVNIYTPVICRYVARLGLQDADVADVAQEVLRTVSRTVECRSKERLACSTPEAPHAVERS